MRPTSETATSLQVNVLMLYPQNRTHDVTQVIVSILKQTLFQHCKLLSGALGCHCIFASLLECACGRDMAFPNGEDLWWDPAKFERHATLLED